jgi:hypothetical protein
MLIGLVTLLMASSFVASGARLWASEAGTPVETMRMANQLYEEGAYGQAAQLYEQLAGQGYADSALYYNLGNVYYRQGEYGWAVLNYRRAQQLAPRDGDIAANLALARSQVGGQVEPTGESGLLAQLGGSLQGWFTLNELAMGALAAWMAVVFVGVLLVGTRKDGAWHRGLWYAQVAAVGALLLVGLSMGSYVYAEQSTAGGVIVAEQVAVTSGPGTQYATELSLHSGAEVQLVDVQGSWARLSLSGGEVEGWVPVAAVELVDDRGPAG